MLSRSGINLSRNAERFIENNSSITILSAYIKLEEFKKINTKKNIQQIVVRWEVQDLCLGVSDIELYDYCKEQGITLYRNTRLHLKAIWDNQDDVFFGSANITGKGVGEKGKYNFELNGLQSNLSIEDKLYFKKIISESEVVDEDLYLKLKSLKEEFKDKIVTYPEVSKKIKSQDKFLLSQLPMSESPELMIKGFFNRDLLSNKDEECLIHDLATYNLDLNLDKVSMETQLRERFNSHPFVQSLKQYIKSRDRQSLNYGGVVRWVQDNTTTVPTPRSWELKKKKIVNILYKWICYFDDNYYWKIPGAKSEVIFFKADINLLSMIDESRDEARGHRAPHQIILLAALWNIHEKTNSKEIDFTTLNLEFQTIWNENKSKFNSKNANIGMPIKAFVKKNLLEIKSKKNINDFRNIEKLREYLVSIKISKDLHHLFKLEITETDILNYL